MIHKLLLSAAALALLPANALAQTADLNEDVIVTASRLNQTATEIGTSVTVITSADIEKLGFNFAVDAIASAPGVTVTQNGSFGGQAAVRIRGAATGQSLVIIDGITVNDPSSPGGGLDFARLDTDSIEKIEILRGPQSTLWGSDAIGGVISVTTKRPEVGFGGGVFAEYGSYNTLRGGASVTGGSDTGDFRLALTATDTDGISKADEINGNTEEDGFESYTLSGRGRLNLPAGASLEATALYSDAQTQFDNGFSAPPSDADNLNDTQELSGNIALNLPLLNGRLENLFLVGYSKIDRESAFGSFAFGAKGERLIYRYQGNMDINARNAIAFGAEHERSEAGAIDSKVEGIFGLYEFKPSETLTVTGGLRLDNHDNYGSKTTGKIAAAYNPSDILTLRATWGQGFKAPGLSETLYNQANASPLLEELKPESSESFDIGFDVRSPSGRGQFGVTYFDQTVEDFINFSFTTTRYGNVPDSYFNIPGAETSGVEVYGNYQVYDWMNVAMSYAYLNAVDDIGDNLIRVPENSGDVTLSFDPQGPFSGAVLARFNGVQDDTQGEVKGWTRIDLNGAYALNDETEVYGRVENLFDKDYQQILGFGTPGVSGYIGVRHSF